MDNNFTPIAARELSAEHLGRFVEVGDLATSICGLLEVLRFNLEPREANSAPRVTVELGVFAAGAIRTVSAHADAVVGVEPAEVAPDAPASNA